MPAYLSHKATLFQNTTTVKTLITKYFVIFIVAFGIFSGCKNTRNRNEEEGPGLIVYCENGILAPVREFSSAFEKNTGIKVSIQNDCARNLSNLIYYRHEADVFIPDCRLTIDNMQMANPELFEDSVSFGYQTLVFIVPGGNPDRFTGNFQMLKTTNPAIILANPETSTLGMAIEILLQTHLVYNEVMSSVLSLTTDSRGLIRSIASGQSQIAIDWESDYIATRSEAFKIDTVHISSKAIHFQTLAVVLSNAPNKQNAMKFIYSIDSRSAKKIFRKYGIVEL
ncbi:MAG: hypothetical protein JG782_292 [Anaerophaga sp.]|nr:hypothetical protein [Anaerophaga sp.]MDI3520406.1 molybdate transport system substrate-binding protein [Anaerophaga sp.]MDK2840562.1 molybdate transport system substrate-binding protein [Anaerophaga sp.]MDN5290216.1 molybdate transport system substrate-binding protein [Anaerophaga sp.]